MLRLHVAILSIMLTFYRGHYITNKRRCCVPVSIKYIVKYARTVPAYTTQKYLNNNIPLAKNAAVNGGQKERRG